MSTYSENLILEMVLVFSSDTYEPVQVDLMKLLPEKDADKPLLTSFVEVFSDLTGEWLYKIKDIATGLDPHFAGDKFISHLSKVIGFPLFDEDGVPLADKRRQLTRAVDSYKQKGSYQGLRGMLRTVGIVSEIKDMFVKKETELEDTKDNYNDFSKHSVSDWFVGDNPPELTDYFKTPHFYINILLTTLYNPGIVESLWNELPEKKLTSVVELMRPVNTWPYKNLFLEFYHNHISGGVSIYNPNILSCYIDRRPLNCFKLNDATLEYTNIVDNDGFPIKNNDGDYILGISTGLDSAWYLNRGIKLNYHQNRERLVPQYYLLGKQNKPFYTFFDSFVDVGDKMWKDHSPDFSHYKQPVFDPGGVCYVTDGYLYLRFSSLPLLKTCYFDLFDKNVIIQFKVLVESYTTPIQSYGCIAQRNPVADTGVKYYVENDLSGNWLFKVSMFNPSGEYELLSQSIDTPFVGWNDIKLTIRGYNVDVHFNSVLISSNLNTGDLVKLGGWDYGSCFTFISTSFSGSPKFKDLSVIQLGNQGQEFTFDEAITIIRDGFENINYYLDGRTPNVSYYNEVWHDQYNTAQMLESTLFGNIVRVDGSISPSFPAYLKLTETRLKITFNFAYYEPFAVPQIFRSGCWVMGSSERYAMENLKVFIEHEYANNARIKIVKYDGGTERITYLNEVLATTDLVSRQNDNWNKMTLYLEEDRLRVVLNDYSNWEISLTASNSPTYSMNTGTRFGFFVKNSDPGYQFGDFSNLYVWRYGITGVKDTSSSTTLLEDGFFDVSGTLLKDHTPDKNNTGDVWHDPEDAWKISSGQCLVPNTLDKSKFLKSYIDVGKKNVSIITTFYMLSPSMYKTYIGFFIRGNSGSKKAMRVTCKTTPPSSVVTVSVDLTLNGESYLSLFSYGGSYDGNPWVVLRAMIKENKLSLLMSEVSQYLGTVDLFEDNLGYNISLWSDLDYADLDTEFSRLLVEEVMREEKITSESDKLFGDLNIIHNEPDKKYEFDFTVDRNLEFLQMSELAFLAGDGKKVLGGATFPFIDKSPGETLQIKGSVEYETP